MINVKKMEKAIEYLRGSHDFAGFTDRPDEKSTTRRIYDIIVLLYTGLNELNNNIYQPENIPILYNKATGNYYDINMLVKNTDITNGTELILI